MKSSKWLWIVMVAAVAITSRAQTYTVIYNFPGGNQGFMPYAGLTMDHAGNLYGTTFEGGVGFGTVFKLAPRGPGWILSPLYAFPGGDDGSYPYDRVVFGPDGSLYGTTAGGSVLCGSDGCGTVFKLMPPATFCRTALCPWTQTVIHRFAGGIDGSLPHSEVVFDRAGELYGTTQWGGSSNCSSYGCGTAFELTPSNGSWLEQILYSFTGAADGANPIAGLSFDNAGNLYGSAPSTNNGEGGGAVFQLSDSGSHWTEAVIYSFQNGSDGSQPASGVVLDATGNLYGSTSYGGLDTGGTAFELSPAQNGWTFNLLCSFPGSQSLATGPAANLVMDSAGNLYGTTAGSYSGPDYGTVFKLSHSNGMWTETILHNFTGDDGKLPMSNVTIDANGNLYGTASNGGAYGGGVVWKITP